AQEKTRAEASIEGIPRDRAPKREGPASKAPHRSEAVASEIRGIETRAPIASERTDPARCFRGFSRGWDRCVGRGTRGFLAAAARARAADRDGDRSGPAPRATTR